MKQKVNDLSNKLMNGFDIRSFLEDAIENMEKMYGVTIGEEEEKFYRDNCV